jgi:acetyltransferase-like isoleucine patch superfamily enzyme
MALAAISKALHKLAHKWDDVFRQPPSGVTMAPSARFELGQLTWKPGCTLSIGDQTQVLAAVIFDRENAKISIGDRCFINGTVIGAHSIEIGDDVLVSWNVTIVDHDSHAISFSRRAPDAVNWLAGYKDWAFVNMAAVKIEQKAWLGFNAIILKGVTIGEGAIIGAGSVVTKSVPPWTIVAGNPARIIREIADHER